MHGFITSDDGLTWYARTRNTPRQAPLPAGTPVTLTGDPAPPPGKSYPPARAIIPSPAA